MRFVAPYKYYTFAGKPVLSEVEWDARDTTNQGWKYKTMEGTNSNSGRVIKRRRADDSVSKLFAYKHKNSSNNKKVQERPLFTERHFWKLFFCIIVVWIIVRVFDFSLVPLSYRGLYINKPFDGLHSRPV